MRQALHIFKKDIRHHFPEILLSLTLLAAYVWNEPKEWIARELSENRLHNFLTGGLTVGVVVSWCILVVRVVQGESLVGDRQFWVTKPYDRKKLLSSKLLFMLAFIGLPNADRWIGLICRRWFWIALACVAQNLFKPIRFNCFHTRDCDRLGDSDCKHYAASACATCCWCVCRVSGDGSGVRTQPKFFVRFRQFARGDSCDWLYRGRSLAIYAP